MSVSEVDLWMAMMMEAKVLALKLSLATNIHFVVLAVILMTVFIDMLPLLELFSWIFVLFHSSFLVELDFGPLTQYFLQCCRF